MKKVLALVLIVAVVFILLEMRLPDGKSVAAIQLGTKTLTNIEIVDTDVTRAQGLSGRESIAPDYGMLFVFENPGLHGFWMKDMNFAIDMIWLDEKGVITGLKENATPESYPQSFGPEKPSLYVLEVSPFTISAQNLKIGEKLNFIK